jgi:hypothetical protein
MFLFLLLVRARRFNERLISQRLATQHHCVDVDNRIVLQRVDVALPYNAASLIPNPAAYVFHERSRRQC